MRIDRWIQAAETDEDKFNEDPRRPERPTLRRKRFECLEQTD